MTSVPTADPPDASTQQDQPPGWRDIAFRFAAEISGAAFSRGDLAELRRMDPDAPEAAAFWRLLARYDLLGREVLERKWALILHGIALMTRTAGDDTAGRSAHNASISVGRALFLGGEAQRSTAFYSETRLNRLLTARGPMLRTLLARAFRMLKSSEASFDWQEMASFILNEGYDEDASEQSRRRIARDYYRAERRAAPANTESD